MDRTGWICPVCGSGLNPRTDICPCKHPVVPVRNDGDDFLEGFHGVPMPVNANGSELRILRERSNDLEITRDLFDGLKQRLTTLERLDAESAQVLREQVRELTARMEGTEARVALTVSRTGRLEEWTNDFPRHLFACLYLLTQDFSTGLTDFDKIPEGFAVTEWDRKFAKRLQYAIVCIIDAMVKTEAQADAPTPEMPTETPQAPETVPVEESVVEPTSTPLKAPETVTQGEVSNHPAVTPEDIDRAKTLDFPDRPLTMTRLQRELGWSVAKARAVLALVEASRGTETEPQKPKRGRPRKVV